MSVESSLKSVFAETAETAQKHPYLFWGVLGGLTLLMILPRGSSTSRSGQQSDAVKQALITSDVQRAKIDADLEAQVTASHAATRVAAIQGNTQKYAMQQMTKQTGLTVNGQKAMVRMETNASRDIARIQSSTEKALANIQSNLQRYLQDSQINWYREVLPWQNIWNDREHATIRYQAEMEAKQAPYLASQLKYAISKNQQVFPSFGQSFGYGMGAQMGAGMGQAASDVTGQVMTGLGRLISGIFSWGTSEIPHIASAASSSGDYYNSNFLQNYFVPNSSRGW
jgi:hypothetical protein